MFNTFVVYAVIAYTTVWCYGINVLNILRSNHYLRTL